MPIITITTEFLTRKEVAKLLRLSYDTVADRAGGTDCLMEIRQTKIVQFNSAQVVAHREAVLEFGKCEGRCLAALQKAKVMPMKLPLAG